MIEKKKNEACKQQREEGLGKALKSPRAKWALNAKGMQKQTRWTKA